MKIKNRLIAFNACFFIIFVSLFSLSLFTLVNDTSQKQFDKIKESVNKHDRELLSNFLKAQNGNLEREIHLISESMQHITGDVYNQFILNGGSFNNIAEELLKEISYSKGYIKELSIINVEKNERHFIENGRYNVSSYFFEARKLTSYKGIFFKKVVKGKSIEKFFLYSYMENNGLLRFELDLDYLSHSLVIDNINSSENYQYFLMDKSGYLVAYNYNKNITGLLNRYVKYGGKEETALSHMLSHDSGFISVDDGKNQSLFSFYRSNDTGLILILFTPQSITMSNFLNIKEYILKTDKHLFVYIFCLSVILLFIFVILHTLIINNLTSPLKKLVKQAKALKAQDYEKSMLVIKSNGDEIEALSSAYSEASCSLRDLIDGLENEIEERTRQYEQAVNVANEANRQKSILLSNVSHEIRTPLNAVIGYATMMKKSKFNHEHFIDSILTSGDTILQLVNDFLDLEKVKASNYALKPTHVPINKLLSDIESVFKPLSMKKNIGFKVTLLDIDSNRLLFVDELRFKQALTNIISNAFKFTKVGKVELRVVLDSEGKTISFDIIDTGVGIPESKFLTIFNSFEQVNKEDENEGFGLGLAITKTIVDLMKGELTVSSKLGKGTIFRLVFSSDMLRKDQKNNAEKGGAKVDFKYDFKETTALIVDDVEFNREILQFHLESLGVSTVMADSGESALAIFSNSDIDIVFTDISMPVMGGVELAKRLRSSGSTVPIVAVTARATLQEELLMRSHFECYITKPISEGDILTALNCALKCGSCGC